MTDCVKPSPGKFKSCSASVASSAFIDGKTNEIFCVSLPSPSLSSTCKLFIDDIYLSWQFLASVRRSCSPVAFPNSRIFHCVTPCKQDEKKGWKQVHLSLGEYFTSKSDEGLWETCLLTCHSHKSEGNLHTSLKTGILCATQDFHAHILNSSWEIVNISQVISGGTCSSHHHLQFEADTDACVWWMFRDKRSGKQAVLRCRDEAALIQSSFVLFMCPAHLLLFSMSFICIPPKWVCRVHSQLDWTAKGGRLAHMARQVP